MLLEEAAAVSEKNTKLQQEQETKMLEDIRKTGKTAVIDKPDRAAFAAKMGPAYKSLETRWGSANLQRVKAAVEASASK